MGPILCSFFLSLSDHLGRSNSLVEGRRLYSPKTGGFKNRSTGGREIRRGGGAGWEVGVERRKCFMVSVDKWIGGISWGSGEH